LESLLASRPERINSSAIFLSKWEPGVDDEHDAAAVQPVERWTNSATVCGAYRVRESAAANAKDVFAVDAVMVAPRRRVPLCTPRQMRSAILSNRALLCAIRASSISAMCDG